MGFSMITHGQSSFQIRTGADSHRHGGRPSLSLRPVMCQAFVSNGIMTDFVMPSTLALMDMFVPSMAGLCTNPFGVKLDRAAFWRQDAVSVF